MKIEDFKTDEKKEQEGVWVDLDENSRVLIARIGNDHYNEILRKKAKPYRAAIRSNSLKDTILKKLMIEVIAESVLLNWEGITEKGEVIPYSRENAIRLLTTYKEFLNLITNIAEESELFKIYDQEEGVKN